MDKIVLEHMFFVKCISSPPGIRQKNKDARMDIFIIKSITDMRYGLKLKINPVPCYPLFRG
jgi:hypothetical protein